MAAVYQSSSCIEWQFAEARELDARLRAAKAAGFELAEIHLWRDKPIDALVDALAETGMRLTSLCVDPHRSIVDSAEREAMLAAVGDTIATARVLGAPDLIIASDVTPSFPPAELRARQLACASARWKPWVS